MTTRDEEGRILVGDPDDSEWRRPSDPETDGPLPGPGPLLNADLDGAPGTTAATLIGDAEVTPSPTWQPPSHDRPDAMDLVLKGEDVGGDPRRVAN